MLIAFDPAKDAINRARHEGISLADYARLDLATAIEVAVIRHGEPRSIQYGLIAGRLHVAVVTYRGTVTRVISLRKANRREVRKYAAQRRRLE